MKLIISLIVSAACLFGAVLHVQTQAGQQIGFTHGVSNNFNTITNAGSSSVIQYVSFIAPPSPFGGTMRLKNIRRYITVATGSPQITVKLMSDNNGAPGSLIESGSESGVLSANSWVTFDGFTSTSNLTQNAQYWLAFVCTSGTSATLYFNRAMSFSIPVISSTTAGSAQGWGSNLTSSSDNGATFSTYYPSVSGFVVGVTDGADDAYFGSATGTSAQAAGSTEKLYTNSGSAQEFGTQFTTPSGVTLRVVGVAMLARNTLSTGDLRYRLYSGASPSLTLLGTTASVPAGNIATAASNLYVSMFSSPIVVPGGTVLSVTAGNTAAGDSTHYLSIYKVPLDTDANSQALLPFGGLKTIKYTGGAWGDVLTSEACPFILILDSATPWSAPAGGGSSVWVQ